MITAEISLFQHALYNLLLTALVETLIQHRQVVLASTVTMTVTMTTTTTTTMTMTVTMIVTMTVIITVTLNGIRSNCKNEQAINSLIYLS